MTISNYINHIAFVLDESSSMQSNTAALIKVADGQIAHLAQRSKELDQETRVSVYTFNEKVKCVIYDKDVLRLPSIRSFYRPNGWTALIDATLKSQQDLAHTAQLYGDHAFLTYVLTDGQDNRSKSTAASLSTLLQVQPDNWTVAVLVPDQLSKFEAKRFGFPADNIAVWDATSATGVAEVGETIRAATEQFMVGRAAGVRGSRSVFSTGSDAINAATVAAAGLEELKVGSYKLLDVDVAWPIKEWVEERATGVYQLGRAYYQLTKPELIQAGKTIAVRDKETGKVYLGLAARQMIGLPDEEVRVRPTFNPRFEVFVQSTSVNRKLVPGTRLLLL